MRRVKCEDCGKVYDFDTDDFCPRCGAVNQAVYQTPSSSPGDTQPLSHPAPEYPYIPPNTTASPAAGSFAENPQRRNGLRTALLIVLTALAALNLLFASIIMLKPSAVPSPEDELRAQQELFSLREKLGEDVSISGVKLTHSEYSSYTDINGYAKNTSASDLQDVTAVFALYSDGRLVNTASAYFVYFPAGEKLPFSTLCSTEFDDYTLLYVTASPSNVDAVGRNPII